MLDRGILCLSRQSKARKLSSGRREYKQPVNAAGARKFGRKWYMAQLCA